MTIVSVNTCTYGSTGRIASALTDIVNADGGKAYLAVSGGRHFKNGNDSKIIPIGGVLSESLHLFLGRVTGMQGMFSVVATHKFLKIIKNMKVDILHLHNLHNSYINLPMLFKFIKKHDIKVVWTLHDCWAFTGHCPYFDMADCNKWKTQCGNCALYREYPKCFIDHSTWMYKLKKKWFSNVENMTVVTPSRWLGNLAKQSFLGEYPVEIINNGIDTTVFKPTFGDFRKKHGCEDKYIVLGVAFGWERRKGLDVFLKLSEKLGDKYQIVLVGTDDEVDKKLPDNIISVHRTENVNELAELYTTADVFVNPTREENFPTVNMESISCGTPVVTFNTGGCAEIINKRCGCVVEKDDIDGLLNEVVRICEKSPFRSEECCAEGKRFDKNDRYREYCELYRRLL